MTHPLSRTGEQTPPRPGVKRFTHYPYVQGTDKYEFSDSPAPLSPRTRDGLCKALSATRRSIIPTYKGQTRSLPWQLLIIPPIIPTYRGQTILNLERGDPIIPTYKGQTDLKNCLGLHCAHYPHVQGTDTNIKCREGQISPLSSILLPMCLMVGTT